MIFKAWMKELKFTNENSGFSAATCRTVVIGASTGGMAALGQLVSLLPQNFLPTVIIVQHLYPKGSSYLHQHLDSMCVLTVNEAEDKAPIRRGTVYTAPANYHLLVERDETFSLSVEEKVNYSRPAIDVLFESAAHIWTTRLLGIILTGANHDGAHGLGVIKRLGGHTIAQDPATAEMAAMPKAAIDSGVVDQIMTLTEMGLVLNKMVSRK